MNNKLPSKAGRYARLTPFSATMKIIREIMRIKPRPICAKCNKIVDAFDLEVEDFNELYLRFEARCHGDKQTFLIHKGYFLMADDISLTQRAFDTEKDLCLDFDGGMTRKLLEEEGANE